MFSSFTLSLSFCFYKLTESHNFIDICQVNSKRHWRCTGPGTAVVWATSYYCGHVLFISFHYSFKYTVVLFLSPPLVPILLEKSEFLASVNSKVVRVLNIQIYIANSFWQHSKIWSCNFNHFGGEKEIWGFFFENVFIKFHQILEMSCSHIFKSKYQLKFQSSNCLHFAHLILWT